MNSMTTKDHIRFLINKMTEEDVIITLYRHIKNHVPAIMKDGDICYIYTSILSNFSPYKYESIDELIDDFLKFIDFDEAYAIDMVKKSDFEKIRKVSISCDIAARSASQSDENYNIINKELEKYGGTYVLMTPSNKVEFLIAACSTDEDYYYVCLTVEGIEIKLSFHTCVGGFISLIDKFDEKEYSRIQSYVLNEHIETLDPKTLRPGHEIITEKIEKEFKQDTINVLFTPIYLIRDGERQIERT